MFGEILTMRFVLLAALFFVFTAARSQTIISGKVKDVKGKAIQGASISIRDSYDGATSDSMGSYKFKTSEKGQHDILASSIGYKLAEQKIDIAGAAVHVDIILKEEPNELKAVVVSAGTLEASDTKRTTVLNPIDIVTTASANADITAAIKTLPGTQQIGESEGLFVRGGTAQESKAFIDGTVVNNFYFSSVPDIAQRGRFSPFIFKGTVFSSGGYSALYGQALSSALILESVDLPERSSASLGVSTVGLNAGYQKLNKSKTASWGVSYAYTNLLPYFKAVPQKVDYFSVPQFHNLEANFRIKTSKTGIVKYYGYFNDGRLGLRRADIDSSNLKDAFGLKNLDHYHNLSWKEKLGKKWKMNLGLSFQSNIDKIHQQLVDKQNNEQSLPQDPYASKSFDIRSFSSLSQMKLVLERRLGGLSAFRFGGEYLYGKDHSNFSNTNVKNIYVETVDHFKAAFAESDIYVTNDLAAKIGARLEHSSLLDKANFAPRISLAQKLGEQGQVSMAYGIFYQKPDRQILLLNTDLNYTKATHYIVNYQKVNRDYTIRAEVFYKKYNDLVKTAPDTSNLGFGEAKGFEVFYRDRKTLKNVDFWISYSYLDTKRDYLNYPFKLTPNFAARHTASLVVKKFVTALKTQFNGSYTFASGRPYYNIRYSTTEGKYRVFDHGQTIAYHNLSFSINYLPNIGKTGASKFSVFVFSVTNVLGNNQVYGYNYSANGSIRQPVTPIAKRFYFFGCFLSFGVDRTEDVINSNL